MDALPQNHLAIYSDFKNLSCEWLKILKQLSKQTYNVLALIESDSKVTHERTLLLTSSIQQVVIACHANAVLIKVLLIY